MTLLNSWKNSLQLLKPSSLKKLIVDSLSILPTVYINFFKFIPLIIILMVASLIMYYYLIDVPASQYVLLGVISILSSIAALVTAAIVKDAVSHELFSFKNYRNHLIIGTCILSVIFALAYYYPMTGLVEFAQLAASLPSKKYGLLELLSKKMHPYPKLLQLRLQANFEFIVVTLMIIFSVVNTLVGYPSLIYLYFLDASAAIKSFFKAIFNGIKFLFFNLPGLIVIYGVFYLVTWPIGYLLHGINTLILLIILIFHLPIVPALNGQLYKKLKI